MNIANANSPFAVVVLDTNGNPAGGSPGTPLMITDSNIPILQQAVVAAVQAGAQVQPGYNLTQINTNGTTTIAGASLYYGLSCTGLGTLWVASVYDVSTSGTQALAQNVSIGALGLLGLAGPNGLGARLKGTLAVVTSGTAAGNMNCLWD